MVHNISMKKCAIVLLLFYAVTICLGGYFCFVALTHKIKYVDEINMVAKQYTLPPYLIASVINVESGYNKNAKSSKNAIGLMQIKVDTANFLNDYYKLDLLVSENDLFNEKTNILYGGMYLRYLINKFASLDTALAAYNAGETRVRVWLNDKSFSFDGKSLDNIPFKETSDYVKKVNKNMKFYKKWL